MDRRGIKIETLADHLNVERQTVANWRSKGVPERRVDHLSRVMATWDEPKPESPTVPAQTLVIYPTREQFRRWNTAAMEKSMLLEDWAVNGLDDLAKEWEATRVKADSKPLALVAEPHAAFKTTPKPEEKRQGT